jgi:hypothetical protein
MKKYLKLGVPLSERILAYGTQGPGFNPRQQKKSKTKLKPFSYDEG